MKRIFALALVLALVGIPTVAAQGAEVSCDSIYCFSTGDFSGEAAQLEGICIAALPEASAGTVMLGTRILRPGDILTGEQVAQMTFVPLRTQEDRQAQVGYFPIYQGRVAPQAVMTLSIRGKTDKAPVAEDSLLETYKNLSNQGKLKAHDPEGEALTYTLVRQPKRGSVAVAEDGTFTYTPKKNKVGVDSFTYTATDPAGNVSRVATVTVQIMKTASPAQYGDTQGQDCRFAAEWLKNTGLFQGECVDGNPCFQPQETVSRGQFLALLVKVLHIPVEQTQATPDEAVPQWLKPYAAAALRAGLTDGIPQEDWDYAQTISGAEAAVMIQNALELTVRVDAPAVDSEEIPAWAADSLTAMADNGVSLTAQPLTRAAMAQALYRVSQLSADAPGMQVLRMQ